jgi:hypothetical protein
VCWDAKHGMCPQERSWSSCSWTALYSLHSKSLCWLYSRLWNAQKRISSLRRISSQGSKWEKCYSKWSWSSLGNFYEQGIGWSRIWHTRRNTNHNYIESNNNWWTETKWRTLTNSSVDRMFLWSYAATIRHHERCLSLGPQKFWYGLWELCPSHKRTHP